MSSSTVVSMGIYTRECLALKVDYRLRSDDVMSALTEIFVTRGMPDFIRSDNGSEFTAVFGI